MSSTTRIRVSIADDHLVFRMGLEGLIGEQQDMELVGEASNGREAVDLYRTHRPHVTLMDLSMPGLDGAQAIRAIRDLDSQARVIALTAHKGDEAAYQAVRAGARGYLVKDATVEEILTVIRAVFRGELCIPPDIQSLVTERVPHDDLTAREIDVLKRTARGLSNKEIARELSISAGTVKNHVLHIIQKLGAQDRTHAVTLALERGILDIEDVAPGRSSR